MASNGRKLLKCDSCNNEVEVGVESKSCICSRCLTGGLSRAGMQASRDAKKEELKEKKANKKDNNSVTEDGQPKKKRGRPKKES